jgi:hypothetical protein
LARIKLFKTRKTFLHGQFAVRFNSRRYGNYQPNVPPEGESTTANKCFPADLGNEAYE